MGCAASVSSADVKKPVSPSAVPSTSDLRRLQRPQPQVDNVENFVVVWLDAAIGSNTDTQKSKDQLQQLVNAVKIFTNPDECRTFIESVKEEKIFLIVSDALGEQFVPAVHDMTQLDSIYVFCSNKEKPQQWSGQFPEVRGVYTSITPVCEQLSKDTKKSDRDLVGFEVVERLTPTRVTTEITNRQDALFMYDQLFREIVLAMKEDEMTDMYDFCRIHYNKNREASKFLAELKETYADHSPVWWYSRDAFLYRMLNKALRTHQYDTLFVLRVFIRHLHKQIVQLQKNDEWKSMELYRGQGMEKVDFERIRANEGGLMSISNFLSTSASRDVALVFARDALSDRKKVSVLMEFKIDEKTAIPFAYIAKQSVFEKEEEWLFSMGSVFRIGPSKCLPDGIWLITLTLTNDNDEQLTALRKYFKKSMEDKNNCVNFAKLMNQLAAWKRAEYFYLMSLETETAWQRRSVLFNDLGLVKSELEQYDEALQYYQQSLDLKQGQGKGDQSDLASTYNNIGTLYYKQKKMDLAIENFQRAIDAYNSSPRNNQDFVATIYNNIATILNDQGKHDEALKNNEKCLNILLNLLPEIHPDIATTYSSIANTFHHLRDLQQALEYAQKAVSIDEQALPPNHPQTQIHRQNLEVIKQELAKSGH